MTQTNHGVRAGGVLLAASSSLMLIVFAFHGPIETDLGDQMTKIADAPIRWAVVHWIAAAALSLFAVVGIIALTAGSDETGGIWTISAWAVVSIGALWTVTTAIAETTVVTRAAASGDVEAFQAWWAFAEGNGNGFAVLALAIAVIAGDQARASAGLTPTWSAWVGTVAGVASFIGWAAGMWFGIRIGNLLWVVASFVMCAWTLWFGVVLMRSQVGAGQDQPAMV